MALIGYVPTDLLRQGKPEEVYAYSKKCIESGVDALNAGCAWPLDTPLANIKAMVQAARG